MDDFLDGGSPVFEFVLLRIEEIFKFFKKEWQYLFEDPVVSGTPQPKPKIQAAIDDLKEKQRKLQKERTYQKLKERLEKDGVGTISSLEI